MGKCTSRRSGPHVRALGGAKMGASSSEPLAGFWTESSSKIASAKSAAPIAASYLRSTQTRRLVRSSIRARGVRGGTLSAHCESNSESMAVPMAMLTHGSNALASGRPKASTHDGGTSRRPRRSLPPSAMSCWLRRTASVSVLGAGEAVVCRGRGVHDEVGILAARPLGNRAHDGIVGRVEAAGEDGR